jgi:uncharacterized delta-60 repeat protein
MTSSTCYLLSKIRPKIRLFEIATLGLLLGHSTPSLAATPTPDLSFGSGGVVEQGFMGMGGSVRAVFAQRDGNVLAVGAYQSGYTPGPFGQPFPRFTGAIARYRADGNLDTAAFGQNGLVDPAPAGFAPKMMLRSGKLVGTSSKGLVRYDADGTIDPAFKTDGATSIAWYSQTAAYLIEQADGRIVAAGTVGAGIGVVVVLRFNVDGSLDTTFNNVGAAIAPLGNSVGDTCAGLTVTPAGKIVVAATANGPSYAQALALMQYNADGSIDTAFGANGRASNPLLANARDVGIFLVRQASGRLVVVGNRSSAGLESSPVSTGLLLTGFEANGSIDSAFGNGGTTVVNGINGANDVKVDIDGKLLVATQSASATSPFSVMRFTTQGLLDTSFGDGGVLASSILPNVLSISLQPDGDLLMGGSSAAGNFAVARYAGAPVTAVEFYNASLDHYFMTLNPYEATDLDNAVHRGWVRTGQALRLYGSEASAEGQGLNPVCRFYIPPQHGDSHFFSADADECSNVLGKIQTDPNYSGYVYETASAFYAALPDTTTGACPAGTTSVYRLWNHRADSNHRYTTDPAIKAAMIASGYVSEGYGPNGVAMCSSAP